MTMLRQDPAQITRLLELLRVSQNIETPVSLKESDRIHRLFEAISVIRRHQSLPSMLPERVVDDVKFTSFVSNLQDALRSSKHDGRLLNVWTVSGLKRNEVRTSAVLGWVLDCNGSHGFGEAILVALLDLLMRKNPSDSLKKLELGHHYRIAVEHSSFGERENRVDIAIEGENCMIFIEVKIDAPEGNEQLFRYATSARRKADALRKEIALVLYLSETGTLESVSGVIYLRWRDVAQAISTTVSEVGGKTVAGAVMRQFASHIRMLH